MTALLRRSTRWLAGILVATTLGTLSCTRMPTAPPTPVVVHGTITGPSGEPVAGIFILFLPIDGLPPDSPSGSYVAKTNSSGSYSIELWTGSYEMRVVGHRGWLGYANRIRVTRDHTQFDYGYHGFKVTGRLLDPEGVALAEGRVTAIIEAEHPSYADADVRDGQFSLMLPPGRYTIYGYAANFAYGYTPATLNSVPVAGDTIFDVRLPGVPVTGTVLGADGAPLANATLDARSAVTTSDANGFYRLYLTEGPHAILCNPQQAELLPQQVVLPIHGPMTIDFDFRGVTWSGTVVTAGTSEPVADCHVSLRALSSGQGTFLHTDAQGAFQFVVKPQVLCELEAHLHDESETELFRGVFRAASDTSFAITAPAPQAP